MWLLEREANTDKNCGISEGGVIGKKGQALVKNFHILEETACSQNRNGQNTKGDAIG
jgi:hypothetical protein